DGTIPDGRYDRGLAADRRASRVQPGPARLCRGAVHRSDRPEDSEDGDYSGRTCVPHDPTAVEAEILAITRELLRCHRQYLSVSACSACSAPAASRSTWPSTAAIACSKNASPIWQ